MSTEIVTQEVSALEVFGPVAGTFGVDASSIAKGIAKLSVNPAVSTNPVALGSNDPILALIQDFAAAILATNVVAPSTPTAGKSYLYCDLTSKNLSQKNDAGIVSHGVRTQAVTGEYLTGIADDGSINKQLPCLVPAIAKNVSLLITGAPADLVTISLPALLTRYRLQGVTGAATLNFMVTETQSGTPVAGLCEARTAAAGGGSQMLQATAPSNGAGTGNAWAATLNNTIFSNSIIVIRQTANSANAATLSFYIYLLPLL